MVFGENKDWLIRELSFVKREDDYLIDVFSFEFQKIKFGENYIISDCNLKILERVVAMVEVPKKGGRYGGNYS